MMVKIRGEKFGDFVPSELEAVSHLIERKYWNDLPLRAACIKLRCDLREASEMQDWVLYDHHKPLLEVRYG